MPRVRVGHTAWIAKVVDGPALVRIGIERVVEWDGRMCSTAVLKAAIAAASSVTVLIGINARWLLRRADIVTVITVAQKPAHAVVVAAAVYRTCIVTEPMVPHPPTVRAVVLRAMAVSVVLFDGFRVGYITVHKVAVAIEAVACRIDPSWLIDDATEPSITTAVDRSVKVSSLRALARACVSDRGGAALAKGWRSAVVAAVWKSGAIILPLGNSGTNIFLALLRRSLWTLPPNARWRCSPWGRRRRRRRRWWQRGRRWPYDRRRRRRRRWWRCTRT